MVKKVLLVLTSHDALGDTGTKTGSWLEELAAPYWTFVDAGHAVDLASIKGGPAPIDPASIGPPWLTPAGARFQADPIASKKLAETLALDALGEKEFDAVYLVGGAGAAYDFPESAALGRTVSSTFGRGKPVAAVCHGVLGLVHARDQNGALLVANRRVTGVSNAEEATVQYDKVLPLLPENALKSSGGTYSAGEPFGAHVVRDGNLHTGQNPASAAPLAQALVRELAGQPH
jgi:putative intracellular protease/amidase